MNHPKPEQKQNPRVSLTFGKWSIHMVTKRITIRTEREVRLSDMLVDKDSGKCGTLLRVEKHRNRMTIHDVTMIHEKGDKLTIRVNEQGRRTTCTRTVYRGLTDIDGKPIADKPESYTVAKATAYIARMLGISEAVVAENILAPLPEESDIGTVTTTAAPAMQEA